MRGISFRILGLIVFVVLAFVCAVHANAAPPEKISDISVADLQQSTLAFVNTTTTPGLESGVINFAQPRRESQMQRTSLGFTADITFKDRIYNGFWGGSLIAGSLDENLSFKEAEGSIGVAVERNIKAIRGSLGFSIPWDESLKIRPYLSLVVADMNTQTAFLNMSNVAVSENNAYSSSQLTALATIGSLELDYTRYFSRYLVEVLGRYNMTYIDTISDERAELDTWGWSQTFFLKGRLTGPTGWSMDGRPWRWLVFTDYANFLDQPKSALGFTQTVELGAGLEWAINMKPLDWFGIQTVGFKVGYIVGEDLSGYNIGLTLR